ncbi:hypothetical protein ST47_g2954 [Ascochyta rabiei]|uniref:Uncharacterized protein n=2 Tax=Didymella rabiei TaxID=5454 RepID=A0A163IUK2_DIDRA|nr:hypothetical protein ST47_g2954 [Ascochyta rabiei]
MLQHPRPLDERPSICPVQPLRRSARATQRLPPTTRTPTPPPLWTPTPRRNFHRRGAIDGSASYPDDTRRHGMILEGQNEPLALEPEALPAYTPTPSTLYRRVTTDGALPPPDPWLHGHGRASRQLELRELQRQWTIRRPSHPLCPTERTLFRPPVSEAYDLPPPYAPRDPYPLFKPAEKRPSMWARVVLYPFVPEGEMLDKAALATDRLAKTVVGGVRKGVGEVGKKAKAVPRQIESTRAKRKIGWLGGRGYVDRGVSECGAYAGAYHAGET